MDVDGYLVELFGRLPDLVREAVEGLDDDLLTAAPGEGANTIAWLLRRMPVFGIPGDGRYGLQPIAVEDLAGLALQAAAADGDLTWDAAGPEIFGFLELVETIRRRVGSQLVAHADAPSRDLCCARGAIGRRPLGSHRSRRPLDRGDGCRRLSPGGRDRLG